VRRRLFLAAGFVLFAVVATANSAGYRYGISDQGYYVPAVLRTLNPALFPRDGAILDPQTGLWVGHVLLASVARVLTSGDLPSLFIALYAVTLALLFSATVAIARGLRCDWWGVAALVALVALRHRIDRTGANTLEGYMHPRMLAYGVGLSGFACALWRKRWTAGVLAAAAILIHTPTGLWFVIPLTVAGAWSVLSRRQLAIAAIAAAMAIPIAAFVLFPSRLVRMDDTWTAAFADRDYLFPGDWPWHAWIANLGYAVVIALGYRRRRATGAAHAHEGALVAGLMALVAVFLAAVPLTIAHVALAVQMQVNRVFWVLDPIALAYGVWWLYADLGRRWPTKTRAMLTLALVAIVAGRGTYLVRDRPLFQVGLAPNAWTDVMLWLRQQPPSTYVLADPQHAWRYGLSVRIGAEKDTLIDASKDPALGFYDRAAALRVAEHGLAVSDFDVFTIDNVRAVAERYALDVFVDRTTRTFDLPVLYRNNEFVVYKLR